MPRWYLEDMKPGMTLEAKGPTVTREAIIAFATQFDPQPFHVDEELAKRSHFGGLVASGWHTAALCMRMMCDAYILDAASLGSPGVDELRWVKPVFAGDTLSGRTTVLEVIESRTRPNRGTVKFKWEVFNQKGELVMHAVSVGFVLKRGS